MSRVSRELGLSSVPMLREARYSQSLERGLTILTCFGPGRPVLGIAEVADELGMSRSTTHRYMITLVALGYLEQNLPSRKYRLGLRVTDLGMSALNATELREHARPILEELRRKVSLATSLAVLDGVEILYVERVRSLRQGQSHIDLSLAPGSRLPAYCTALGKILLAYLPDYELNNRLTEMTLSRRAVNTITSKKTLRETLTGVREAGYVICDQELASGLQSIAVPVYGRSGEVIAALNLASHNLMISRAEFIRSLLPYLMVSAGRLSAQLGYCRQDEQKASV